VIRRSCDIACRAWESDTTLHFNEASCHEPGNTSTFSAFLPAADQAWEVPAMCIDTLIEQACQLSPNDAYAS